MKLHIWTNRTSFLAIAHAESVADARERLKIEIEPGVDGSCPEREAAWRAISGNTPSIYVGPVAEFCLSASAELAEQLTLGESQSASILRLTAEITALRAEAAGLRAALQAGKDDYWAATTGSDGQPYPFSPTEWVKEAEAALTRTPDQHRHAIAAEVLREFQKQIGDRRESHIVAFGSYVASDIEKMIADLISHHDKEAGK